MPDSSDGSITRWLHLLAAGDHDAARKLWEFFAPRLNQLAKARLRTQPQGGVFDEEDVVQSAFAIFCQRIQEGRYPDIKDRNELWQLLAVFTSRRATYHLERLQTQKRSGVKPPGVAACTSAPWASRAVNTDTTSPDSCHAGSLCSGVSPNLLRGSSPFARRIKAALSRRASSST